MRLDGQVAIITGAGRGIGQAIALAYAREGARLVLVARSTHELEDTARQAQGLGVSACVMPADVSLREQVDHMVAQVIDRYSTIDILVNNAGIAGPVGVLQDNDPDYWVQTLQVNLIGTYLCCRAVLPVMLKQDRGQIINMSGSGGMSASPDLSAYCTSKAAVVRLTEGLAMELAQTKVHVNAMRPGAIHTRLVEEMRDEAAVAGRSELYEAAREFIDGGGDSIERAADLAVFLACGESGSLSGRLISVSDDFANLPDRISEITGSEVYQLRRVELP
jgi:NAD(P)-dependent dehydrogenase (short-subunit alcohol dehydrogenase family)